MARPKISPPYFDDLSDWGIYRPSLVDAIKLSIAHRLPLAFKPAAVLLRKNIKHYRNTPLDLEINGLRLRLLPRGNISEEKYYTAPQLFDKYEFYTLKNTLKPESIFIDIGANAGIYSYHAYSCMRGHGRILAIEPDPEMVRRLSFNKKTNALSSIEIVQAALSDKEGIGSLIVNETQRGMNTLNECDGRDHDNTFAQVEVKTRTLISILKERNINKIDALKIDIEGHEITVLNHFFHNSEKHSHPNIIISEFTEKNHINLIQMMKNFRYRKLNETRMNIVFERQ